MVCFHAENEAFDAMEIARRSSRSVKTWNSDSGPVFAGRR